MNYVIRETAAAVVAAASDFIIGGRAPTPATEIEGPYTGMTPFVYFSETNQAMLITNPPNENESVEGLKAFLKDCRGH